MLSPLSAAVDSLIAELPEVVAIPSAEAGVSVAVTEAEAEDVADLEAVVEVEVAVELEEDTVLARRGVWSNVDAASSQEFSRALKIDMISVSLPPVKMTRPVES